MIKKILKAHSFFVRESKLYCGRLDNKLFNNIITSNIRARNDLSEMYKYSLKQIIYYLIAYFKFMRLTILNK